MSVPAGQAPYAFVDAARRARAAAAVEQGVACILRTQVRQGGQLTGWCAQHDEKTLLPAWARKFEPPSLSGNESVGLVAFLLDQPPADRRDAERSSRDLISCQLLKSDADPASSMEGGIAYPSNAVFSR